MGTSLLSSVVERTTLDRVVVGSIPTGGTVLVPGRKIMDTILTPLGLMGDEGPSRES